MIFRRAQESELSVVWGLYRSAIGTPGNTWSDQYPTEEMMKEDYAAGDLYVVEDDGKVVAAISRDRDDAVAALSCWSKVATPSAEVARIVVSGECRGRGIGPWMVGQMAKELRSRGYRSMHLLVSKGHERAQRCYAKQAFVCVGETNLYDGDWWCYEKDLSMVEVEQ